MTSRSSIRETAVVGKLKGRGDGPRTGLEREAAAIDLPLWSPRGRFGVLEVGTVCGGEAPEDRKRAMRIIGWRKVLKWLHNVEQCREFPTVEPPISCLLANLWHFKVCTWPPPSKVRPVSCTNQWIAPVSHGKTPSV